MAESKSGFTSTMRRGFFMDFSNGLHVSVQWGAGNYCDNYFPEDMDFPFSKDAKSTNAEVAVIKGQTFIDPQNFISRKIRTDGMVVGWLSPEEVAEIIYTAANMTVEDVAKLIFKKEDEDESN